MKILLFLRMVSIKRYIFFLPLFLLLSCSKSGFKFDFDLDKEISVNYNVTYYSKDEKGGATVQAVASVREGKCELEGMSLKPTLAYISTRKSSLPLVVYVQKGNVIKITGDEESPLSWNVKGNKINDKITSWRLENKDFLEENISDSINASIKSFVEINPDNPVSTILMLTYFNRDQDERGYNELMGLLEGEAREPLWLDMTARADQMFHIYSFPAKFQSLIMRGSEYGVDTFYADGRNPVLISFWQTGFSDKNVLIDSLKVLEKKLPDSIKNLADICLDIDSMGWRNSIRRDSLKVVKRFWTPLGLNDPTIQKLKVKALPYYIVFDKDGIQDYRGTELSEAIKTYRKLMSAKDTVKKE